ncbi:c-type cytochrome [Pontibacter ruber]|uniref:C-type cytochrome n=1 Tax=Pontibacter ruber TaxID=1343895 RepID=A0ABW5CZF1_9BACT|nr:c-type cytochrome [Pontibacter ruber]
MKKILTVLTACAVLTACSEKKSEYDKYYEDDYQPDTTATAAARPAPATPATPAPKDNTAVAKSDTAETGATAGGAAAGKEALAGKYEKGEKLIAMSDCLTCHKDDQRVVGPSYVEVAQKYEFNDKNIDYLAGKIIKGGAGVWGQVPMSPHPDLKKEDAEEMARYVLSLRK